MPTPVRRARGVSPGEPELDEGSAEQGSHAVRTAARRSRSRARGMPAAMKAPLQEEQTLRM
ncbi:MAG: hypothetical protein DRK00_05315 [Thermoprotei archaeon]|nr:MAG: hypothetical protein DRK00_05315 [Thermoprotei archaeon]